MQRSFALLIPMLLAAAAPAGCQKKKPKAADPKKEAAAAPAAGPLTIEDVQPMLPETLAGLPRQLVAPEPDIPQISAYYQDEGNTRSGHVRYTMLEDPARILKYYEGRFPERAQVDGRTAYLRVWQPKAAPETAEGCLVVGQAIGVCVDIAPGKLGDLAPLFAALPLADLEKRATAAAATKK